MDSIKSPYNQKMEKMALMLNFIFIALSFYDSHKKIDPKMVAPWLIVAAGSLQVVVLGALLLAIFWIWRGPSHFVILDDQGISSPIGGIIKKIITIPYSKIVSVKTLSFAWQDYIEIRHKDGKLTIPKHSLPNQAAFD